MIIKPMDSLGARKLELKILKSKTLPPEKVYMVEQEWKKLIAGEQGEKNTAYHLDFFLDDKKNWMLIHDLRLEYEGKVAQIDHLIITRALDIYVLETKAYGDTLHILDDGSFIASYGQKEFAIPSPIEQNKRHIYILEKVIQKLLPKRLGKRMEATIEGYVLIDTKTILKRSKEFDSSNVIKAEQFLSMLDKKYEQLSVGDVLKKAVKIISQDSVLQLAKDIVALHKPNKENYKERFNITDDDLKAKVQKNTKTTKYFCAQCGAAITQGIASFCSRDKQRFKNKTYCMTCQKDY